MNEQEMRKKYRGIKQFQVTLTVKDLESVLNGVVSALAMHFDFKEYERVKGLSRTNKKEYVYCVQNPDDPRCLILIEFKRPPWPSSPSWQFVNFIIRFYTEMTSAVQEILCRVKRREYQDCLVDNSKMNDIVKRHGLQLDIVDEFDLMDTVFRRKEFWTDYYRITSQKRIHPELVDPIELPIADRMGFSLHIGDVVYGSSLHMDYPSLSHPVELGWDDEFRVFLSFSDGMNLSGFVIICHPGFRKTPTSPLNEPQKSRHFKPHLR